MGFRTKVQPGMDLTISYYKGGERTDEDWNDQSLSSVQDIVCQWVRDGKVERVEIRNPKGVLICRYPQERHGI